jgi:hypothetical protein
VDDTRLSPVNKKTINKKKRDHVTYATDTAPTETTVYQYHSNMGKTIRCKYCMRTFPSAQGRRSHLAQVKKCGKRWHADLDAMRFHRLNLFRSRSNDNNERAEIGKGTPTDSDLLINPFSQSNQLMIPLSKKSTERIITVTKTTVKVHHHPNLDGERTSLIKQDNGYAESPPCSNHCAVLRSPEGNQYGANSQMKGIGSLQSGYWSREQLINPQISFLI